MTDKKTWLETRELYAQQGFEEVNPNNSLRPNTKNAVQLIDLENEGERLIINNKAPYGSLTKASLGNVGGLLHLLKATEDGKDFVSFDIDEEVLTLRSLSLGTGRQNASSLEPVYFKLGGVIKSLAEVAKVPKLTLADFALKRTEGEVVVLPPINFEKGVSDAEIAVDGLATALKTELKSVFKPEQISLLSDQLREGAS